MRRRGRPTKLEQLDLTVHDIEQLYLRLGTYRAVREETGISERTIKKYLKYSRIERKRGPRRGKYGRYYAEHPDMQNRPIAEVAREAGFDYKNLREYVARKRAEQEREVRDSLRRMLHEEGKLITQDGRRIPMKAVRYAVIQRWHWGEPVRIRFHLRNGVKVSYDFPYTPEL